MEVREQCLEENNETTLACYKAKLVKLFADNGSGHVPYNSSIQMVLIA